MKNYYANFSVFFCKVHIYIAYMHFITSERSEQSSYWQTYLGRFDDMQTALRPLKKSEKIEIHFYGHFRTS